MKRLVTMMVTAGMALFASAEMARSVWLAKVGDSVKDAAVLKETIAQLSAADQVAFVQEVNAAIAKMPGSQDVKAATFLEANRAALTGASREVRAQVLAEVFATVPVEFLTVINENFAQDLFNRNANPAHPFTDAEFTALVQKTMGIIVARCAKSEDAGVRDVFAALMFERASAGQKDIREVLLATLPENIRETARKEWMPAALSAEAKTYDPMLGTAGAGEEPNHATVLTLASSQVRLALLSDMQVDPTGKSTASGGFASRMFTPPGIAGSTVFDDRRLERVNRAFISSKTVLPSMLKVVRDENGNVMHDAAGREMYRMPDGSIVYKQYDSSGDPIYVDENGYVARNPYYKGKDRDSEPSDYLR